MPVTIKRFDSMTLTLCNDIIDKKSLMEQWNAHAAKLEEANRKGEGQFIKGIPSTLEKHSKYAPAIKFTTDLLKACDRMKGETGPAPLKALALATVVKQARKSLEDVKGAACVL